MEYIGENRMQPKIADFWSLHGYILFCLNFQNNRAFQLMLPFGKCPFASCPRSTARRSTGSRLRTGTSAPAARAELASVEEILVAPFMWSAVEEKCWYVWFVFYLNWWLFIVYLLVVFVKKKHVAVKIGDWAGGTVVPQPSLSKAPFIFVSPCAHCQVTIIIKLR